MEEVFNEFLHLQKGWPGIITHLPCDVSVGVDYADAFILQ